MNNTQFVDLPSVRRFRVGGVCILAGALLLSASSARATTVRLTLGANGTYAAAYSENEYFDVDTGHKTDSRNTASAGETWYLTAETTVAGYVFDKWEVTPAAAAQDVTLADPASPDTTAVLGDAATYIFTAKFKKPQHVLTIVSDGHSTPNSPTVGDHSYDEGREVRLGIPAVENGYVFDHWAPTNAPSSVHPNVVVDYSGTTPKYTIIMDDDYQIMAVALPQISVTHKEYNPTISGSTYVESVGSGSRPTISVPEETVLVNASERWACSGWTDGGPDIPATGASTSYTFLNPIEQNNELTWAWTKQYCVVGSTDGNGDIVGLNTATGDNRNWFDEGSALNVVAVPTPGYVFAGWIATPSSVLPAGASANRVLSIAAVNEPFVLTASFQLLSSDSDGDGLPDEWELAMGLDPYTSSGANGGGGDPDNDGLSNLAEYMVFVDVSNRLGRVVYANPLHCDSDGDGLDDGWEYNVLGNDSVGDLDTSAWLPALVDAGTFAPDRRYGRFGNPDGDFRWDTASGWELANLPLYNHMEYEGPDGQAPYAFETVAPGSTATDGWQNTLSKTVVRRIANPEDTGDGSMPLVADSDGDGFDDGFEYSWDQWHQASGGVAIANTTLFPGITETVETWDSAAFRPFNPAVPAANGNIDQDYLYGFVDNGDVIEIDGGFNDIDEYNASGIATNAPAQGPFYPVTRQYVASTGIRWCTNPFLWDTDMDGMPDGWEMTFGYDPWFVEPDKELNPDNDYYAVDGNHIHHEVYQDRGFNPYTGWGPAQLGGGVDTAPFTSLRELMGVFHADDCTLDNQAEWRSTNPRSYDQDHDGIWDGWELYVNLDPAWDEDAVQHYDTGSTYYVTMVHAVTMDDLTNFQEFNSSHTPTNGLGVADYRVPGWYNKTFPTDPWDWDTDSDQILDGDEKVYFNSSGSTTTTTVVTGVDSNGVEIVETATVAVQEGMRNGGLCPTTADTDNDMLPDAWEAFYGSMESTDAGTCNGTIKDHRDDPDNDGLMNLQEYLFGAVAHWQFQNNNGAAIWESGWGLNGYDPYNFFDPTVVNPLTGDASGGEFYLGYGGRAPHGWDVGLNGRLDAKNVPPFLTGPDLFRDNASIVWFSTGDPMDYDTDQDGMDDYWEAFHGLNPLFGVVDVVRTKVNCPLIVSGIDSCELDQYNNDIGWAAASDFRRYSWLAGNLFSDSDQDQLSDIDESLQPRYTTGNLPPNYHTDPSPLWMTDISSPDSFANLYFWTGSFVPGWFWGGVGPTYFFDFEMNEGFDSDGDFVGDRAELVTSLESPGVTDPLDAITPVQRRALYLNGDAAARTGPQFGHDAYDLSLFTVDCWIRPENPASGREQVILERSALAPQGSSMQPDDIPVVNFRLGLDPEGRPFIKYNGSQNPLLFVEAKAQPSGALSADTWYHLAATYGGDFRTDGQWTGKLRLYVNGETVASIDTSEIPFSGWIIGLNDSGAQDVYVGTAIAMPIVVGAADDRPDGRVDGHEILVGAGAGTTWDPPSLKSFFQGWVDQIRIWNDPLTQAEILYYKDKRFTRADVVALAKDPLDGGHGLLYSYSFDNLPDPDHDPVFPKGYETLDGRPAAWIQAPFWGLAPDRSEWYDDYRVIPWIENQVYHNPFDVPRDQASENSPYLANTNAFFANTANPYGVIYKFGMTYGAERHPFLDTWIEDIETREDMRAISLKPDLLPLRWAAADEDVEMWDNLGTGRDDSTLDSDGDGLPDAWEIANGLDHLDASGVNGRYGDIDGDGLSNYAEFLVGTDPWAVDTDFDGIGDFDDRSDNPADDQRTFGERLTDNDFVEDTWEAQFDAYYASPALYDAHFDHDDDGWDNWSEARAHTDPDKAYKVDSTAGTHAGECPTPTINATIRYEGVKDSGTLVVHAYSSAMMDGKPDAVLSGNARHVERVPVAWNLNGTYNGFITPGTGIVPGSVTLFDANGNVAFLDAGDGTFGNESTAIDYATGGILIPGTPYLTATYSYGIVLEWPMTVSLDVVTQGWLRQGRNYFWAFLDADGNGEWDEGEPAGLADGYVHEVGWDRLDLDFTLTDEAPSFARLHWNRPADDTAAHLVRISYVGKPVFERAIRAPRSSIHEGDFIYAEDNALLPYNNTLRSWGLYGLNPGVAATAPIYEWYLDGVLMGTFTNHYASSLAAPVPVYPKGAAIRYARPEFRFHLSQEATQFQIQIRQIASGSVIFDDKVIAPPRRREGSSYDLVVWQFPYCVNQYLPGGAFFGNGGYQWRVRGISPYSWDGGAWSSGPDELSDWQEFSMNVTSDAGTEYGAAWLQVDVRYYGAALTAADMVRKLRVQAFTTASFNDRPAAEVVADGPGIITIAGLTPGSYYLRAFVDQDMDFARDDWETWGYVRMAGDPEWPFTPEAVAATTDGLSVSVVPELVMQNCDTDQDGLPDAWEYRYNSAKDDWLAVYGLANRPAVSGINMANLAYADADGDGLNDYAEYVYGSNPTVADSDGDGISDGDEVALGFATGQSNALRITSMRGAALDWAWDGTVAGAYRARTANSAAALGTNVNYVLERATSLEAQDWTPVASGCTAESVGTLAVPDEDLEQAFYRVRAIVQ